nr:tripartite tricarboxylate transporter substrate binding protein [Alkalispirochaeta alkalica]
MRHPRGGVTVAVLLTLLMISPLVYLPLRRVLEQRSVAAYPSRTVEMIVSFKEGGGTDIGARVLAEHLSRETGQPVVVRNVEGKDGEVGYAALARARPDGYTIGFINLPTFVSLPAQRQTSYRVGQVVPVANYVLDPAVLVVRSDSSWDTLGEWLEYCRSNPMKMTVSNNGIAASNHIAAALLEQEAGIELTHVPFGGTSDMLRALHEGYVDASVAKVSEVVQGVRSGEFRVLAFFTESRHEGFPQVPTLREAGYPVQMGSARAIAVPAGTHPHIVSALHDAFLRAYEHPGHQEDARSRKISLHYMSSEDVLEYMHNQERFLQETLPRLGL